MRHLVGIILAGIMAAAVFFAGSWGYVKLVTRQASAVLPGGSLLHDHAVLKGLGALAAVGLLAGLLIAVPRISPVASGLPGLVLLAWTGLYLFSVRHAVQYIPLKTRAYGLGFEALLFDGMLAMAGLAMIIPLFVPSRWRRGPVNVNIAEPVPSAAATTTYPDLQATQTMAGQGGIFANWAQTRPQPRVEADNPDPPGRPQAPWGPAEYG